MRRYIVTKVAETVSRALNVRIFTGKTGALNSDNYDARKKESAVRR